MGLVFSRRCLHLLRRYLLSLQHSRKIHSLERQRTYSGRKCHDQARWYLDVSICQQSTLHCLYLPPPRHCCCSKGYDYHLPHWLLPHNLRFLLLQGSLRIQPLLRLGCFRWNLWCFSLRRSIWRQERLHEYSQLLLRRQRQQVLRQPHWMRYLLRLTMHGTLRPLLRWRLLCCWMQQVPRLRILLVQPRVYSCRNYLPISSLRLSD